MSCGDPMVTCCQLHIVSCLRCAYGSNYVIKRGCGAKYHSTLLRGIFGEKTMESDG